MSARALSGWQVLVTRPQGQAEPLLSAIRAAGGRPAHIPVLAIAALGADDADRTILLRARSLAQALERYQHVIFISTNAVQFGAPLLEAFWPQWPLGLQWHAIGAATAAALREHGMTVTAPDGSMDSDALLALPSLQQLSAQRVLIVRGVGGRDDLAVGLRARGAQVDYLECYHRQRPLGSADALAQWLAQRGERAALCVHSGESLHNLLALATGDTLRSLPLVVPGERVAALARQAGFSTIAAADNATTDAIVAALVGLARAADNNA